MKISYDYEELITELHEELDDGILKENSEVLILRGKKLFDGYRPIIDWYYSEDVMLQDFIDSKKESEQNGEPDELLDLKEYFAKDYKNLESITVKEMLDEMIKKNEIM